MSMWYETSYNAVKLKNCLKSFYIPHLELGDWYGVYVSQMTQIYVSIQTILILSFICIITGSTECVCHFIHFLVFSSYDFFRSINTLYVFVVLYGIWLVPRYLFFFLVFYNIFIFYRFEWLHFFFVMEFFLIQNEFI